MRSLLLLSLLLLPLAAQAAEWKKEAGCVNNANSSGGVVTLSNTLFLCPTDLVAPTSVLYSAGEFKCVGAAGTATVTFNGCVSPTKCGVGAWQVDTPTTCIGAGADPCAYMVLGPGYYSTTTVDAHADTVIECRKGGGPN